MYLLQLDFNLLNQDYEQNMKRKKWLLHSVILK